MDFVDKQFTKEEIAEKVKMQYDDEKTITFYQCVMGGGGHDIHFGIFHDDSWGVKESSQATTDYMCDSMNWAKKVKPDAVVLDLGSGHGGGTHAMVQKFGCKVQCFNLGANQNAANLEECKRLGIADKVEAAVGNLNDPLPEEWTEKFDYVWSCEVLCHAADKAAVLKEVKRVLKPGGVLVFSDLMGSDFADEKQLKDFTDRNATSVMGRPSKYIEAIRDSGLQYVQWWDGSFHLAKYFSEMVRQIDENREEMMSKGLDKQYIDNWHESLTSRVEMQKKYNVFAWGVFVARKDPEDKFPVPKVDTKTPEGLTLFNEYLQKKTFLSGLQTSPDDLTVYMAFGSAPDAKLYPNVSRWYNHIGKIVAESFPGASRSVEAV